MRIYFAHPISDYSTPYEWECENLIHTFLPRLVGKAVFIENPNQPHHQEGYQQRGMDHFMEVTAGCDGCVFDSFPGGIIGSGVAMEVKAFLDAGKPVWKISWMQYPYLNVTTELPAWVASREITREMSKYYKVMPGRGR